MEIIMEKLIKKYNIIIAIVVFIGIPLLFYSLGNYPRRSILKESISILTILALFQMLSQFYLARSNKVMLQANKMASVVKVHKFIGYFFVSILLLHPILIVFPRYFESGVEPITALIALLTSFDNTGVLLGMIAYVLMLILGLTSLMRNKLSMSYKSWRVFHGILSVLFIGFATLHVIKQGRHSSLPFSLYIAGVAFIGILLLLKMYFSKLIKRKGDI